MGLVCTLIAIFISLAEEVSTLTIVLLRLGDPPLLGDRSLFGLRASTCTLGGTELNVYHISLRLKVNFTYKYVWGGFTMTVTIIPLSGVRYETR